MSVRRALMLAVLVAVVALPGSAHATFNYPSAPIVTNPPDILSNQSTAAVQPSTPNHYGLTAPTYVPPGVNANGVYTTPITPGSKGTTATYNLNWSIGTNGKSGCLVCHGDPNLVRVEGGKTVSLYVNTVMLNNSAHANLLCTDCHIDFAYKTPHPTTQAGDAWLTVAKSSCGQPSCHPQEYLDWSNSAHATAGSGSTTLTVGRANSSAPGMPKPLCGDCHSGHTIPRKDDAAAQEAIHGSALTMCGRCHTKSASSYDDYYHGAAYRRGAPDAPACWQCHGTHLILPSDNLQSSVNMNNLVTTCAQCHKGAGDSFVQAYAPFIHSRQADVRSNPIVSAADTASAVIQDLFHSVFSAFGKGGSQ